MLILQLLRLPTTRQSRSRRRHLHLLPECPLVEKAAWDATRTIVLTALHMTEILSDAATTTRFLFIGHVPPASGTITNEKRAIHGRVVSAALLILSSGQKDMTLPCHWDQPTALSSIQEAVRHHQLKDGKVSTPGLHDLPPSTTLQLMQAARMSHVTILIREPRLVRVPQLALVLYHLHLDLIQHLLFGEAGRRHQPTKTLRGRADSPPTGPARDQDRRDCQTGPASTYRPA